MQRHGSVARGAVGSRPPSAPPVPGQKRKEREYERETGDETNINVVVRCRGRNEREVRENSGVVVSTTGVKGTAVELSMGPNAISNKTYQFDKVYSPAADQATIFEDTVSPILSEMLGGFNCTIFAYGQTGTGKTYTMSGDMTESCGLLTDAAGIIPRVLQSLFQKLDADEAECSVKCSFIELYNEELRDLLAADDSVKLKIFDDANKKNSATMVQGMEESHITSAAAGIELLQKGSHRRQVAATKCNDLSSRSHTVFTITTYMKRSGVDVEDYICTGKLNLVDLAGSENIQRSGAENKRAIEAGLINKSLLTLGRVINALVDKGAHIPYRESKLTRLLQDSLGGRTKTCIIATVSPARSNLEETISTLDYAFRAKNIRNKPQINSMISKRTLLREFTAEIEKLKGELIATRQRNGVYMTNDQFEEMTIQNESRRILSEEQKARIEAMEVSLRNKVQELFSLTNTFTSLKKDNEQTRISLENTKDILQKTEIVLANTKRSLDEESRLRQKYADNEDKMHIAGHKLISTIDSSLQDVDELHSKLRRRSALHRQNQNSCQDVQSRGRRMLVDLDNNLENLKDEHSVALTFASKRLQVFVDREHTKAQQAQKLVEHGLTSFDQAIQTTISQSSSARDGMNEVLEEIKVLRDDVKAKVGQGLNGLSEAAAKISGEVISELDSFHTQLHASYSSLGKEFKAIFDDLTKQLATQREESDKLRKALQEANHASIQAQLHTATELESAVEAERQAAELDKQELLAKMTELVTKSSASRQTRLDTMLTNAQTGVVDATEALNQADKIYSEGMNLWQEHDSEFQARMIKSRDEMKAHMKRDWSTVNARNTAIQESTKAVHQETVKIVQAQVSDMDTQMAALDEFVTRARKQNEAHFSKHISALDATSTSTKESFEQIDEHVRSEHIKGFSQDMSANLASLSAISAGLAEQVQMPLQSFQNQLSDFTVSDYQPTGHTPQKKDWQYARDLPRTIPRPDIDTPKQQAPQSRMPARSPRKFASPRKSPKKQMVRVDTPPTLLISQSLPPPAILNENRMELEESSFKSNANSTGNVLKDVDVNIVSDNAAPAALTIPSSDNTTSSQTSSTDSRPGINSDPSFMNTSSNASTDPPIQIIKPISLLQHGPTSASEKLEKENIPVSVPSALPIISNAAAAAQKELERDTISALPTAKRLNQSMYAHAPRQTRSSTAAANGLRRTKTDTVIDFARSMSG